MKKTMYAFIMLSFFLFSCGGGGEKAADQTDEDVKTEQSDVEDESGDLTIKDCDDFLDKYEEWVDDYLVVVEAFLTDASNMEVHEEYRSLTESLPTWSTEWPNYVECGAKEKYQKRFDEIGDKLEKGMEKLGFGN